MTNSDEVRNPRYAGATIGDLVRGLMRPRKPKPRAPEKEREDDAVELDASRVRFQRRSPPSTD